MIETLSSIEPLLFDDEIPRCLADLVCQILQEVSGLERALQADALGEIAGLVQRANESSSHLLDHHRGEPASAAAARAEAVVLRAIVEAHAAGTLIAPTSMAFLTWAHRSFHQALSDPEPCLSAEAWGREASGPARDGSERDGDTGLPIPRAPERVGTFMAHFERRFGAAERWPSARIVAVAAAHHRLNLIRPFADENARVSRLMSHAMVLRAGIGGGGLWSISRGLARQHGEYHHMMRQAGRRRTGDRDGRGQLSAAALREFSEWMLSVMLEQVKFARASFAFDTLEPRYRRLLRSLDYDDNAQDLAAAILRFGRIDRGDACVVLKTSERTARNALSRLVQGSFLTSATPKGPVRIAFPIEHCDQLFPQLFAGRVDPLVLPAVAPGSADTWSPPRTVGFCDSDVRDKDASPC